MEAMQASASASSAGKPCANPTSVAPPTPVTSSLAVMNRGSAALMQTLLSSSAPVAAGSAGHSSADALTGGWADDSGYYHTNTNSARTHNTGGPQLMGVGTAWLNHSAEETHPSEFGRNSASLVTPAATGMSLYTALPMVSMSVPGVAAQAGFGAACQNSASTVPAEALMTANGAPPPGTVSSTYPCPSGYGAWYGAAMQQV